MRRRAAAAVLMAACLTGCCLLPACKEKEEKPVTSEELTYADLYRTEKQVTAPVEGKAVYKASYGYTLMQEQGYNGFFYRYRQDGRYADREKGQECWQGGGAWLDGRRLAVAADGPEERALIGVELPYQAADYAPVARRLIDRFYGRAAGLRMNGSAAVSLCYVAAGRFAAWAEKYIRPWDFSAGWLLVTEAGGAVAGFGGGPCDPDGDNIVAAATPDLLRELLAAIG